MLRAPSRASLRRLLRLALSSQARLERRQGLHLQGYYDRERPTLRLRHIAVICLVALAVGAAVLIWQGAV